MTPEDPAFLSDVWARAKAAYKRNPPGELSNEQRVHLRTLLRGES